MNRPDMLFTYDGLPIASGGAHRIRVQDHRAIWSTVSDFLRVYTTCSEQEHVELVLYEGYGVSPEFSRSALAHASQKYGPPRRSSPVSGKMTTFQYTWAIASSDIPDAIELIRWQGSTTKHWLGGPMLLCISAAFSIRDPDTGQPFPLQGSDLYGNQEAGFGLPLGVSVMHLRLANPSTCALFLSLPFSEVTPKLQSFLSVLEASLPFKLSRKHWSRWQLNAKGVRYCNRRVSVLPEKETT